MPFSAAWRLRFFACVADSAPTVLCCYHRIHTEQVGLVCHSSLVDIKGFKTSYVRIQQTAKGATETCSKNLDPFCPSAAKQTLKHLFNLVSDCNWPLLASSIQSAPNLREASLSQRLFLLEAQHQNSPLPLPPMPSLQGQSCPGREVTQHRHPDLRRSSSTHPGPPGFSCTGPGRLLNCQQGFTAQSRTSKALGYPGICYYWCWRPGT